MYAITGITGKVGGALAATLLAAGLPVRAVVRDATKGWPGIKRRRVRIFVAGIKATRCRSRSLK